MLIQAYKKICLEIPVDLEILNIKDMPTKKLRLISLAFSFLLISIYSSAQKKGAAFDLMPVPKKIEFLEFLNTNFRNLNEVKNNSLILIQSTLNRGFAGANNLGLKFALARNDQTAGRKAARQLETLEKEIESLYEKRIEQNT